MSSGSIRIIQLPEKSSVNTDDYMAVDSSANGTKKVKFTDLLDDNLSTQNKAADAQATGEAISELNTNINNTNTRIDNMINTQQNASVTTLWTGTLTNKNQSVTLSESIANFDFIDVYGGDVDVFYIRKPVTNTIIFDLQTQNLSDDGSTQFLRWWETGVRISGTTATITKCVKCYWDDFSQHPVVSQATVGTNITRINGVKIGHIEDDEIVDARVGANGITYSTLGDAIRGQVTDLENDLSLAVETNVSWSDIPLTLEKGYYDYTTGIFTTDTSRRSAKISVNEGEKYRLSTYTRSILISGLIFFNSEDAVISHFIDGTGNPVTTTDYEFVVPHNAVSMAVQSADYTIPPTIKKQIITKEFVGYTKDEIDTMTSEVPKKYGVKWELNNNDDLGARCFDAVGLSATIGIGSTDGASDFDSIYPWSEIKRCNIVKNANGAETVVFEGETGFALDGTNGDVFVRIPKFYYERYRDSGFEYRVISAQGTNVHPVFIEDGKELDEIFISAFEGYKDSNDKLRSIGGVIPTSNITAQEFLTSAQANGINYSLYDNRCVDAVFALLAIEYGCRNSNQILGYGLADFEQPVSGGRRQVVTMATETNTVRTTVWNSAQKGLLPVGSNITVCDTEQTNILTQAKLISCVDTQDGLYTDWTFDGSPIDVDTDCFIGSSAFNTNWCEDVPSGSLSWHTGRALWQTGNVALVRNPIRYRWIENIFGNLWHFLPDVTFNALQMYVCKNMRDYVMHKYTAPYYPQSKVFTEQRSNGNKSDVTGYNYWITDLDNNIFEKGIDFGRSYDLSLTSDKAFGAYYYLYAQTVVISNGGGFDHLYRCNILTQRAWQQPDTNWYLYGARLMYKHLE